MFLFSWNPQWCSRKRKNLKYHTWEVFKKQTWLWYISASQNIKCICMAWSASTQVSGAHPRDPGSVSLGWGSGICITTRSLCCWSCWSVGHTLSSTDRYQLCPHFIGQNSGMRLYLTVSRSSKYGLNICYERRGGNWIDEQLASLFHML